MPIHNSYALLVHKFKLIPIAVDFCATTQYYAVVLITMIATLDAVHINPDVPISSIGNE